MKCPICDGKGTVDVSPDDPYEVCLLCGGEGTTSIEDGLGILWKLMMDTNNRVIKIEEMLDTAIRQRRMK